MKTNHMSPYLNRLVLLALTVSLLGTTLSCRRNAATTAKAKKGMTRQQKGALIGIGAGAATGAAVAKLAKKNVGVGAVIGAAAGGTGGYLIARYMDKQAEELRRELAGSGAAIERIGDDEVRVTFRSGVLFAYDSDRLTTASKQNLAEMDDVLKKYGETEIRIAGHTDAQGSDAYNQRLSERRAASVVKYMTQNGVERSRLQDVGYGESQPISSNDSDFGRERNRRVEVSIKANKKLQRAAKRGDLEELEALSLQ